MTLLGQVLAGRANHRQRRSQLVRHGGDELHLLLRQPPLSLRAAREAAVVAEDALRRDADAFRRDAEARERTSG